MTNLWPWLAIAGLGALHGLSPANGWMFAAAWGVRARREAQEAQVRRTLLPIAIGHAASVAVVACAFAQGMSMDRTLVQGLAGALLVGAALYRLLRGAGARMPISTQAGYAGIALWSFLMATAHGAGLMLIPALVPLCLADTPAREITASGSLVLALAAVGVHTAAMLVTTGVIATGVCRGVALWPRLLSGTTPRQPGDEKLKEPGRSFAALTRRRDDHPPFRQRPDVPERHRPCCPRGSPKTQRAPEVPTVGQSRVDLSSCSERHAIPTRPRHLAELPGAGRGVIHVDGIHEQVSVQAALSRYVDIAKARLQAGAESDLPAIQAWRRAFAGMGLKPTQTVAPPRRC